jgi:Ca2+-binding EF-hand superfamily protein
MASSTTRNGRPTPVDESYEDYLPIMANKLGGDEFVAELCKGFRLLADQATNRITFDSLKRNAASLGIQDMGEDELLAMIREGDLDGDGALTEEEFCILMIRTSPAMMDQAEFWLENALDEELLADLYM